MQAMARALTLLIAVSIGVITLMPQVPGPAGIPGIDKVFHFVAFAILVMPMAWSSGSNWPYIVLLALVFGGIIELIQPNFGRSASWWDFLMDGLGAVFGAQLALRLSQLWSARRLG